MWTVNENQHNLKMASRFNPNYYQGIMEFMFSLQGFEQKTGLKSQVRVIILSRDDRQTF